LLCMAYLQSVHRGILRSALFFGGHLICCWMTTSDCRTGLGAATLKTWLCCGIANSVLCTFLPNVCLHSNAPSALPRPASSSDTSRRWYCKLPIFRTNQWRGSHTTCCVHCCWQCCRHILNITNYLFSDGSLMVAAAALAVIISALALTCMCLQCSYIRCDPS
jgi:hypothetical protein